MILHVTARFVSRDDSREQLKTQLIALAKYIQADKGCNSCTLTQSTTTPNDFLLIEEWQSQAALDTHLAEDEIKNAVKESEPLLSEAFSVNVFKPLI